jgi:hypothetical protein
MPGLGTQGIFDPRVDLLTVESGQSHNG